MNRQAIAASPKNTIPTMESVAMGALLLPDMDADELSFANTINFLHPWEFPVDSRSLKRLTQGKGDA